VKPAPFAYKKARSLDEALGLIAGEPDAKLLAGGQSLIAALNMRLSAPPLLVDINGIDGLDRIEAKNGSVSIGALVRHAQAERSDLIAKHAPLIARALPHIAHPAVRNRGTIGGSIAYADPAAELPACLLALGGEVIARGAKGERVIAADDFFRGLFETALAPGEILTGIRLPAASADTRIGFAELARRHGDYALVGLAASARANGKNLRDVRLAFFGVGNTPLRQPRAERALAEDDIEGAVASLDLTPADDIQATGAVRKHLAGVLLRRVAAQLMDARA
jgi:carbon-monoxide dehydrogenase medium subunit